MTKPLYIFDQVWNPSAWPDSANEIRTLFQELKKGEKWIVRLGKQTVPMRNNTAEALIFHLSNDTGYMSSVSMAKIQTKKQYNEMKAKQIL